MQVGDHNGDPISVKAKGTIVAVTPLHFIQTIVCIATHYNLIGPPCDTQRFTVT